MESSIFTRTKTDNEGNITTQTYKLKDLIRECLQMKELIRGTMNFNHIAL